jgi:hypothetical protein
MIFKSDLVKVTTDAMEFKNPIVELKKKTGLKTNIIATKAIIDDDGNFKGTETAVVSRKEMINIANKMVEWVVDLEEELDKPTRMKNIKNTFKEKLYAAAGNVDIDYADEEEPLN